MPSGPAWAVPPNAKDEFPEVESFVRITDDECVGEKRRYKIPGRKIQHGQTLLFLMYLILNC